MNIQTRIENNKTISSILSVVVLSCVFDILWAFVIISTIYLLDHTFNAETVEVRYKKNKAGSATSYSRYKRQFSPGIYFKKHSKDDSPTCTDSQNIMFFADQKKSKNSDFRFGSKYGVAGQPKPSLMSLIHRKSSESKENYRPSDSQPLLAVVKNNMYLRRSSAVDSVQKSPLYRSMQSPTIGRSPSIFPSSSGVRSPSIYNNSGMRQFSVASPYNSPHVNNAVNTSINGLEVHGSYFINKSVLHSEEDSVNSFSLVNNSFNSPAGSVSEEPLNEYSHRKLSMSCGSRNSKSVYDHTSTAEVVSLLKEKSKRKRPMQTQQTVQENQSAKKTRFNDETFDSTLNELFPPVVTSGSLLRKKLATIRSSKKRYVSTASQYERPDKNESTSKRMKTAESLSRSKFGLSEQQATEMLVENNFQSNKEDETNNTVDKSALENAVKHVKETLTPYQDSVSKKIASTVNDKNNNNKDSTYYPEGVKQSALRNLKSPFKKLLHTNFPSNLQPGSTEKRRKHPVYFTAKIDIDEIQSNREEFGSRGASLKAFRLDQEEASNRVNDLFEEVDDKQTDLKKASFTTSESNLNGTTTLQQSNLLNVLKTTSTVSSFSFGAAAPVTTSETTPAANLFNTSTSQSLALNVSSSTAATTANSSSAALPVSTSQVATTSAKSVTFAFNPASTAVTTGSFSFKTATTSQVAGGIATTTLAAPSTGFSFANKTVSDSSKNTTAAASSSTGFSFGSTVISAQSSSQLPGISFAAAPFSFGTASSGATSNTLISTVVASSSAAAFGISTATVTSTSSGINFGVSTAPTLGTGVNPSISSSIQSNPSTVSKNLFGAFTANSTAATSSMFTASSQPVNAFGASLVPSVSTVSTQSAVPTGFTFGSAATQNDFSISKSTEGPKISSSFITSNLQPSVFPSVNNTSSIFGNSATTSTASGTQNVFTATSTKNIFGAMPTSSSTTTAPSNGFGVPATSSNIFGVDTTQNVFSVAAATTTGVFGATTTSIAFGSAATAPSVFGGGAVTTAPNLFGATTTDGGFGATTTNAFGAPTTNAFGANTTNTFGAAKTSSVFGTAAVPSGFGASSTSGVFQVPTNTNNSSSIFGAPPNATNSSNIFGAPANTTNNTIFGAPANTTNSSSMFGSPTKNAFSASSTANVFGNSNTSSVFGQQPQTNGFQFGSSANQNSVFGQQNGNAFGAAGNSSTSVFGNNNNPTPFGNNAAASNPFGEQRPSSSAGFDFSASLKQPSINFGAAPSTNSFGVQPMAPAPVKPFGMSNPATPNFNAPSTPNFGTPQQPSFGTPQASSFGQQGFNTPSAGAFAIGSGNNPSRPTQRARRRMRR